MNTKQTLAILLALSASLTASAGDVDRGKYLVTIMDCAGCHTDGALAGKPDGSRRLAGSTIGFAGPFGVVYPPNLTPDPDFGLGKWSEEEMARAIRYGTRPDGRVLVPVMPWPSYSSLTDEDVSALVAYLRTLTPVPHQAPPPVAAGEPARSPYLTVQSP